MNILAKSLLLALCASTAARGVELLLDGDRATLHAKGETLRDVLTAFARAGVSVQADPLADKPVTATYANADLSSVFRDLLAPYGYAAVWQVIRGPLGDLPRLATLQVYLPDAPRNLKDLVDSGALRVTRGPAGGPEFVADEMLLAVKKGTTLADFRRYLSQIGATVVGSVPELGAYLIRFQPNTNIPAMLDQLRQNAMVDSAEPNYVARIPNTGRPPTLAETPREVNFPTGAARVAVLDSGLMPSAGLGNGIVGAYDALTPDRAITDPDGHGTQMALIASGAIRPDGAAQIGEVNGAPIIAVRAFDDAGQTSNFALMRAITYAIEQGARVINLSWGTETPSEFLSDAVRFAQSKGLVVVAAAGNEPTGNAMYPASYKGVVGVSALNPDGSRWEHSNFGNQVVVAAPGAANLPVGHDGDPGRYAGTSIASAYVANQIAAYLTRHPEASAKDAVNALIAAVGRSGKADPYLGFGKLDAAALERLR